MEAVIPCRPTDPEVEMTFMHRNKDITQQLGPNGDFEFDPRRGLVIERGSMTRHTGLLQGSTLNAKWSKSNSAKAAKN